MSSKTSVPREGSLEAPTRHAIDWTNLDFYNEKLLFKELERVYDICHGCRRCVSLCHSFPTLFDLVDESETFEVDGIAKKDYWKVVDHCYLCDLCYMTKCPYVPPHEWNVDFPHLMLRAKAVHFKKHNTSVRNKILSSTDLVGRAASLPVINSVVNFVNQNNITRKMLEPVLGVHSNAIVPRYQRKILRNRIKSIKTKSNNIIAVGTKTKGKVVLFTTCYANYNEPHIGEDLIAIYQHNGIKVTTIKQEQCCGMPKLELGDLDAVKKAKDKNIPQLLALVNQGWDIVAPVSSCVLMFKQELPLMFPHDADVQAVKKAIFDPFEYLFLRHKDGLFKTDFNSSLGKVAYQVACHQRVQNIGLKTRDIFNLIPDTEVIPIERCSGHDGTYAVKKEFHEISMKIAKPVVKRVKQANANYYTSDCPMAGHQIKNGLQDNSSSIHTISLLRKAYGI
ncbi:Fe-S oxidoreductase-like protein in Rubrerythrin cluster [hydrothermal vent metagenome]|uniref:Fe-S oxidoreductase-like protein in Rubrerythrin cluster n=1 Tax=hydrothermal vent metagenome TaxID=652676 RepID=A0A3B1A3M3_9ZZZZ